MSIDDSRLLTDDMILEIHPRRGYYPQEDKYILPPVTDNQRAIAKAQLAKDIKWLKTRHKQVIGVEDSLNCFVIPVSEVIELEGKT